MASNLFTRYVWLIDTIRRYGAITRQELDRLWQQSTVSDGSKLARRTFYNYRNAIADLFGITIECNPSTYEYYIADSDEHSSSVTDWMLNSATVGNVMSDAAEIAGKIFVEDVPSAREHLSVVITSLKENRQLRFDYYPYTRVNAQRGIVIEPYFLKIFRQRWYVTGRNVKDGKTKTYALDRMKEVTADLASFTPPADFDAEAYQRDSFGIVFTEGTVKEIAIKADTQRAKYLRALPLHRSQSEAIHDDYSIFHYRMRLTGDLLAELLSFGPSINVLSPPELKAMITTSLKETLARYDL